MGPAARFADQRSEQAPHKIQIIAGEEGMSIQRRRFLQLTAASAAFPVLPRAAAAQTFPSQPIRIVVGFAAGSGSDIFARLMAQWLTERLGWSVLVENRPGAGGNIGTESVVKASPDGYTLLQWVPANAVNNSLYPNLSFNFLRDIAPVAGTARAPYVVVVNPNVPVKTIPELIAHAKANPGKLNFASAGVGTGIHMAGELFKMLAGVEMVHVPYRGAAGAMTDLIGGQVQLMFDTTAASIPHIKSGKVRALAVTTATRSALLPDLPTVGDFVKGYEASGPFGLGAPTGTPPAVLDRLNREINAVLADPKVKARLAELGSEPLTGSPADIGRMLAAESEKWAKVVKAANIKVEGT
jgi:tripartite-type tricarboxylate transporter receptor subunit TctC